MNTVLDLVLRVAGMLCLVSTLFITRSTWRADVEPFVVHDMVSPIGGR